jgi:hypothetical protein
VHALDMTGAGEGVIGRPGKGLRNYVYMHVMHVKKGGCHAGQPPRGRTSAGDQKYARIPKATPRPGSGA